MRKNITTKLAQVLLIATTSFVYSPVFAESSREAENIEVTPTQGTTQEELAAIHVLSEICPNLIGKSDEFNEGYARLVHAYLPDQDDALNYLNKRSQEKNFKKFLNEARNDAKAATDEQNTQICKDVMSYQS